ncbi:FepA family TonB-dependent siderophore receptor [Pseudogemmobacter faecipullorum]|uniref:FepA family TonB-dependent siderophore receptor n=1 Tax=Pseudogemmobacter faecipullorum TaxID=2755041 RepID=A0ABS8CID1_9RHOB|nr:FepA family TonB-dependent siderophore receptor [Pseudogemmobacter faecipullorum]MCB5409146.1 FepA family TonB-dependent siderophore receptor [Pseudogemmobacter faecipullorum]
MARSSARLASGTALSLLLSTGILIGTAYAQEAAGEDEAEALGTIVLSAEDQIKQALGVSTVTSEDLAKTPVVNDISEIIRKMPGVNLTGATASGQRGNQRQIDLRGMGPENTLILIDGKPVNSRSAVKMGRNGERDSRGDSNWVPADLIERIEVIRGPAAARYGSGAAGGVVNIITKRPEEMTASVGLHFNSPERGAEGATQRGSFMVAGPAGERLSFRLHGGYARTDADALDINDGAITDAGGTRMLAGREGVVNKDLGALLTWQAAEGHEVDFEASASRQGNIYAGDTQLGSIGTIPAGLWGQETNRMYRRTFALSHRGDYDFGTSNSYVQLENTNNTRLCEGLAGSGEGAITNCVDSDGDGVNDAPGFQTIRTSNISAKTEWMLPLNLRGKETMLTLGAEVRHEKIDDPASITVTLPPTITGPDLENDPSRRDTKLSQTTIGLFAEANIYWNDRLILTPGLRYDHNSGFGSNVSPSLNAEYTFSDEVKLKVGVARAFKAPNVFQLNPNYVYNTRGNGCPWVDGVRLPGPCYVAGNPDLDAEISLNKEIGVAYEGENGLSASVTWFHNDYKNKIYSGQVQQNEDATTNRLFRWENTGPAVIEGIEGNFATAIGEDLMLNTNFTYMIDSKIKSTGQPLSLVPDYTINASLDWAVRDDMLLLLSATHYGPIQPSAVSVVTGSVTEDPNERGGYTLWNLGMKWEMNEATQLSAGVSNLFDKQVFRTETSGGSNTFNEPGRAFYIGLNATF